MITIIIAIILPILFLLRDFKIKEWREQNIDSLSCTCASKMLALPIFVIILIYIILSKQQFTFSKDWVIYSSIWIVTCFCSTLIGTWLFKSFPITQLKTMSKVFSFVLAIILDIILFKVNFNLGALIAVILLFFGGIMLNPKNKNFSISDKNIITLILASCILSAIGILEKSLMKHLAMNQTNLIFFTAYLQTMLFSVSFFTGIKGAWANIKMNKIKKRDIVYTNFLIIIYCLAEPFMFKELPLTLIISISVITIALSYVFDVKNKYLEKNTKSLFALGISLLGMTLLIAFK